MRPGIGEREFVSLDWHDAVLLGLNLDRSSPGERDEVVLRVEWPDGRRQTVRFLECYALVAEMNFGVIAEESILGARLVEDDRLAEVRRKWAVLGVDLSELRCFALTTNSTASELRIYAKRFEILDAAEDGES